MSQLDNIVQMAISKETPAVSRAGFGTFGIIGEFASDKTATTFIRDREYAGLDEMLDDGWEVTDAIYKKATAVFSQNPKLLKILVGRKDSGDSTWPESLTAINGANPDWYMFSILASKAGTIVFAENFVTDNVIAIEVNGIEVSPVTFTTDQETTMGLLKSAIESAVDNSEVTISTEDPSSRTLIIEIFGGQVDTVNVAVTLGATQPTASITYVNEDDYKAVASWALTQKKIFMFSSADSGIKSAESETDIANYLKSINNERVACIYDPIAQGETDAQYLEDAWPGECLPFDVGAQTWAYKTLRGVQSYNLTSAEISAVLGKNANIYTKIAGVDVTRYGTVSSGEYIDIIRGIDALESAIQEEVFIELTTSRKIPYTNEGITLVEGLLLSVLNRFADQGFLIKESIIVTVPVLKNISASDRAERFLPDITFEAEPQGAIHTMKISGKITL